MVKVREPEEKDLMHFTRYAIDFLHTISEYPPRHSSDVIRDRKYWAADQFSVNNPKQKLLVADLNGRMIGYVIGIIEQQSESDNYGFISEVMVDEFYRREGIGTELCRSLIEWMQNQEITVIQFSLRSYQNGVNEFLLSIGFAPVSTLYEYEQK